MTGIFEYEDNLTGIFEYEDNLTGSKVMATAFEKIKDHSSRWIGCQRCELWRVRQKVCIARGTVPCDILFVGEGPGDSEDAIGQPFMGPAGQLLNQLIAESINPKLRLLFSNLIGCIPIEQGKKTDSPPHESILACKPRLEELIQIATPKMIVAVGRISLDWLTPGYRHSVKYPRQVPLVYITHPAAILRGRVSSQNIARRAVIVALQTAMDEYFPSYSIQPH